MDAKLSALGACKSNEEVEKAVEAFSLSDLVALEDSERSALSTALTSLLNDDLGSKLKRRIKRLISNLEDRDAAVEKLKCHEGNKVIKAPQSLLSAIGSLKEAQSSVDVESCLNSIYIPPRDESGQHSAEFLKVRPSLKSALTGVLERTELINNRLSRRITRLIFALLTDSEREMEKKKAAERPKQAPPAPKASKSSEPAPRAPVLPLPLTTYVKALAAAETSQDVEEGIKDLNVAEITCVDAEEVTALCAALDVVLADSARAGNAKLKRRLMRIKDSLLKLPTAESSNSNSNNDDASGGVDPAPVDFQGVLRRLRAATSSKEVETALAGLVGGSQCTAAVEDLVLLKEALVRVGKDGALVATAALRRRVKRASDMLDKLIGGTSTQEGGADEEDMVVVHNPTPGPPLEAVIRDVRAASSGEGLLEAIKGVKPGSGNNKSRRTLLRALTAILADEERVWIKELNSKARRSVQRVQASLGPVAQSGAKAMKRSEAEALGLIKSKDTGGGEGNAKKKPRVGEKSEAPNPYILFFGQLSFSTTKEHIRRHLDANGVGGVESIRILTQPSGDSKGMAFVEMNSSEDMHKALVLHHTVLNGRRINVEKSCGGGRESKRGKLGSQREAQEAAVRDRIDAVIQDFERRAVLTKAGLGDLLLARLYSFTAAQVASLLGDFEQRPKEQRTVRHLDLLMDKEVERLGRSNVPHQMEGEKEEQGLQVLEEGHINE